MARSRTARIPKPKAPPLAYQLNDELTQVAATLFAKHEVHFNDLRPLKIGYVMVAGGREPKKDRIDGVWARFVKVGPLWKGLTGYDAIVWVREAVWRILSKEQRQALVAHELSHGTTNDKGELVVQRHDLEDFAWVARHYGAWHENVELYGKQLSLFGKADEKPANGHDAFAWVDAKVAERKAEREGNVTPMRPRPEPKPPVITP